MRIGKIGLSVVAAILLLTATTACGKSGGSSNSSPTTLTYWASNQGSSLADDKQILQPELDKFEKQTGIKVNLEVISWTDLLNRVLAAATSGKGPDVINIGNTWSASLQATGTLVPFDDAALTTLGGKDRFLPASFAATGAAGKTPTSVPLYGLAYSLYYNKKMFADAGISQPPATWTEFQADAKKLTHGDQWGVALEASSLSENSHFAFILGQQHGAELFDSSGKPQFDSPQEVAAVKQYVDFMAADKIANPSSSSYGTATQVVHDFATGKAAMMLFQSNGVTNLNSQNMPPDQYGVAPIPFLDPVPPNGKHVDSHVAGINMAIFKNTKNLDGAEKFVKFMTSTEEQQILNKAFGSLPVVTDAYSNDPDFNTPTIKVWRDVLQNSAAPLPEIPQESQFETTVGTAVKALFADAATGKTITDADVKAKLTAAAQQMASGG